MNSVNEMKIGSSLDKQKSRAIYLWNEQRRKVLPLMIVTCSLLLAAFFIFNKPESEQRSINFDPALTVAVHQVVARDFQVNVQSYGNVAPRTQSFLVAQVSGRIVDINDKLREGSFFDEGDVLLQIDDRDYVADTKIAEADLADARRSLAEETARSAQAMRDWERIGNEGEPGDLVLRKPQLVAAEARVASTDAALTKAKLSLERTQVTAPFAGRVLRKMVDLGQVTGNNTQVAEVYATDFIEVRLPLRDSDLQFIDLPESYRGVNTETNSILPVTLYSSITGDQKGWQGQVVRTESAIDENSRQLHVVAQIEDPFGEMAVGRSPLKIGEYVTAELQGRKITDAIVIPADAIYQSSYAYVVEDDVLIRREVEIGWQNQAEALIVSGLKAGDQLVTTTLGQVTSGLRVAIEGEVNERPAWAAGGKPGAGGRPEGGFSGGSGAAARPSFNNAAETSNTSEPFNSSKQGDRS